MGTSRSRRGRSEGSIYQRKDGRWCGVVSLGVRGGKRIRRVVYGVTKSEAAEKLRKVQAAADAGQLPDTPNITVAAWLARWLDIIRPTVEPNTLGAYSRNAKLHIVPRIGDVKLMRLRAVDVEMLYARCLREGVSPAMVRKIGTTLSVALNHAVRSSLMPSNPTRGVKRPKAAKPKIEILDAAQSLKLVAACEGDRLGSLFVLMLDAGCRPGEALALTWRDIDFATRRISITKTLEDTGRIKRPKTPRSIRQVELSPGTLAALNRHRAAMLAEGRDVRRGHVWITTRGGIILPNDLTRGHLRPLLAKAGLPPVSAYALRHTCATLLIAANVHAKIVCERLGHASITMTMDTYGHMLPGMQSAAVDVLARVLHG